MIPAGAKPPLAGEGREVVAVCLLLFGDDGSPDEVERTVAIMAQAMREHGAASVQVATAVGYRHHSTFSTAFTRHFGVAPKRVVTTAADPARGSLLR